MTTIANNVVQNFTNGYLESYAVPICFLAILCNAAVHRR